MGKHGCNTPAPPGFLSTINQSEEARVQGPSRGPPRGGRKQQVLGHAATSYSGHKKRHPECLAMHHMAGPRGGERGLGAARIGQNLVGLGPHP